MTGETMRDLLDPLIGKRGSIYMVVSRTGPIGFATGENKKLTGVEKVLHGLVRLERESGWALIRATSWPWCGTATRRARPASSSEAYRRDLLSVVAPDGEWSGPADEVKVGPRRVAGGRG